MSVTSALDFRTISQALDAVPTAIGVPDSFQAVEIWAQSPAAWTFRRAAGDIGFPVPANEAIRLPCDGKGAPILVEGSDDLYLAFFGRPAP